MQDAISTVLDEYDIIVTTGAVSAGRCDFIPGLVNSIGGRTVFHKAAVKPGHPILFSMLPSSGRETAFFGLPGNPVAAAACLRFFVLRYLQTLQLQTAERPQTVALKLSDPHTNGLSRCDSAKSPVLSFRKDPGIFRPGILSPDSGKVWIIDDHSPGKTKPFLSANCWVHIPRGVSELGKGSAVDIYPC
jgi:molybdopterin molybdotransferase